MRRTTFAPTSGNHDAGGNAFVEHFNVERNGDTTDGSYYSFDYGKAHFADRILDTAPFIFHGAYMDGCLTRLSTESLVNVTSGGGSSLATFVVEPR